MQVTALTRTMAAENNSQTSVPSTSGRDAPTRSSEENETRWKVIFRNKQNAFPVL